MNDYQFWQTFVSPNTIFNATSSGIVEMLRIYFQFFPDFVWTHIPNEGNVVQIAIKNRQEKVFSLLSKSPTIFMLLVLQVDESQNTTSHMAARLASPSISGATFPLQRDLQWFKVVEKLDHPFHKVAKNQDGKTPWQVFKEEHKPLLEEENKWMKDTSNSYMLVATLIATVAFAASITVPGGTYQDQGIPIFWKSDLFMLFVVSDALALSSSMASLLIFLAVLKARYAEEDFLVALPRRLKFGSWFLIVAIAATMISFSAALSFLLVGRIKGGSILITLMACIPTGLLLSYHHLLYEDLADNLPDMISHIYLYDKENN